MALFENASGASHALAASAAVVTGSDQAFSFTAMLAGSDIGLARMIAALVFCLALGVGAIFLMRRWERRGLAPAVRTNKQLRIVQALRLNARSTLYLVEYGATRVLIGCGPGGITSLHAHHDVEEPSR